MSAKNIEYYFIDLLTNYRQTEGALSQTSLGTTRSCLQEMPPTQFQFTTLAFEPFRRYITFLFATIAQCVWFFLPLSLWQNIPPSLEQCRQLQTSSFYEYCKKEFVKKIEPLKKTFPLPKIRLCMHYTINQSISVSKIWNSCSLTRCAWLTHTDAAYTLRIDGTLLGTTGTQLA